MVEGPSARPLDSPDERSGPSGRRRAVRVGLALGGLVATAALVHAVGAERTLRAVLDAAAWMPLALLFEGGRIYVEARLTRHLYARLDVSPEAAVFLRAQLLTYPIFVMAPAGRATAEAAKAGILARHAGSTRAAAIATVAQAVALVATALISAACALAATLSPPALELASVLWTQTALVGGLGLSMLWGLRRPLVGRAVARILTWAGVPEDKRDVFGATVRRLPPMPWPELLGFTVSRALSVLVFFVLLIAVGAAPSALAALRTMGASLVGAAAFDVVPGDLGLTEGAFALWSGDIGVDGAEGVAMALLFHATQLAWVALGALAAWLWREPQERRAHAPRGDG